MNKKTKKISYNIFIIILLFGMTLFICQKFIHLGNVEYTDNAQVKQHIIPINCRIQGYVKQIYFDEYQFVKKGDTLIIIEDTEYKYLLAQAEANYENAITDKSAMYNTINTIQNNISMTESGIEEARIKLENAERNFNRYKNLLNEKSVTRQQYDNIKTNYDAAKAHLEMLLHQKQSTQSVKEEQNTRLGQNNANIKLAEATLELARLNLSYTVITAPCDGITGRKNIQVGQLIQPGQTILNLVDNNEKWIVANYKETQATNIAKGQIVEIKIDAIPNVIFNGVVKSISRATGASFSLLPQDNSAGNFVKIEQRIPIRIDFTSDNKKEDLDRISAGMNAETTIKK